MGLISTTAGGLDPGWILFPMLPLGLGGRVMAPAVRTLYRGHKVVDFARVWGHAVADAVTEKFGGDSVPEVRRNVRSYLATLGDTLPITEDQLEPGAAAPSTVQA